MDVLVKVPEGLAGLIAFIVSLIIGTVAGLILALISKKEADMTNKEIMQDKLPRICETCEHYEKFEQYCTADDCYTHIDGTCEKWEMCELLKKYGKDLKNGCKKN